VKQKNDVLIHLPFQIQELRNTLKKAEEEANILPVTGKRKLQHLKLNIHTVVSGKDNFW